MLSKIKTKLSKPRKCELSTNTNGSTNTADISVKPAKENPTESRDITQSRDALLNDAARQVISDKDANVTNAYTDDPTKEVKVTLSPLQDKRAEHQQNGPILYINNTYDLPPLVPAKKSKESSKVLSNDDVRNGNPDVNTPDTVDNEDNKENNKVKSQLRSPLKNRRDRNSTSRSNSRNRNERGGTNISRTNSKTNKTQTQVTNTLRKGQVKEAAALKNEALKIMSQSGEKECGEDSDDYYITCELPGPNSIIAQLDDDTDIPPIIISGHKAPPAMVMTAQTIAKKPDKGVNVMIQQKPKVSPKPTLDIKNESKDDNITTKCPPNKQIKHSINNDAVKSASSIVACKRSSEGDKSVVVSAANAPVITVKNQPNETIVSPICQESTNSKVKPLITKAKPGASKTAITLTQCPVSSYKTVNKPVPSLAAVAIHRTDKSKTTSLTTSSKVVPKSDAKLCSIKEKIYPTSNRLSTPKHDSEHTVLRVANQMKSKPVHQTCTQVLQAATGNTPRNRGISPQQQQQTQKQLSTSVKADINRTPEPVKAPYSDKQHEKSITKKDCASGNKSDKMLVQSGASNRHDVTAPARHNNIADDNKISAKMDNNCAAQAIREGYSSLADVRKYFTNEKSPSTAASPKQQTHNNHKVLKTMSGYTLVTVTNSDGSDSNDTTVQSNTTKSLIRCDVNVHGGKVATVQRKPSVPNSNVTKPVTVVTKLKDDKVKPGEGYTTLDDFLGSKQGQVLKMPKEQLNLAAKIMFENNGARPKQRTISNESRFSTSGTSPGSSPSSSTTSQLDINLNILQYQREVSHESGYDTSGSGFRSHSSSSNEFFQHDLSNYSLLSECTDHEDRSSPRGVMTSANSDVTPANMTSVAKGINMYAYVPKSSPKYSVNEKVKRIGSEDTLKDSSDTDDSGNDVTTFDEPDVGDDIEDETNDYLPPIPTRNYDDNDKTNDELFPKTEQNRISIASSEDSDVLDGCNIDEIVAEFKRNQNKNNNVTNLSVTSSNIEKQINDNSNVDKNLLAVKSKLTELKIDVDDLPPKQSNLKQDKISPSKLLEVKRLLYSPIHKAKSGFARSRKSDAEKAAKRSSSSLQDKKASKESVNSASKSSLDKTHSSRKDISTLLAMSDATSNDSTPIIGKRNISSPDRNTDSGSEFYHPGSFSSESTASNDNQFWATFDEPVHMSWEEVVSQANDLGIPLPTVRPNRNPCSSSGTSGDVTMSPNTRMTSQTLPYPKANTDRFKRFSMFKDKFASLFNRKHCSNTERGHSTGTIQSRNLPRPPGCYGSNTISHHHSNDDVDGGSPSRRQRQHSTGACQVHGTLPSSPRHHHSNSSMQSYCSDCSPTKMSRMTKSYHQGAQCSCSCSSHSNASESYHSNASWHGSFSPSNHHQLASNCQCCHRISDSAIHETRPRDCRTLEKRGPLYPKAAFHTTDRGSRDRCQGQGRSKQIGGGGGKLLSKIAESRSRSHTIDPHQRDRSQSRDVSTRSRSPHVSATLYPRSHGHTEHCCCHGNDGTKQTTRSCSSSGIVQRCPPSPAPSSATSVMSAPSAFSIPLSRDHLSAQHGDCCIHGSDANADFIGSLSKLKDVGWYWGPLSWDEAESKLVTKPDGSFIVRDSSDDRYILSLSFRSQAATHHTRIEHYKGMFSFYSQPKSHGAATIIEFIEKAMEHSRSGKFLYFLRPRAPGLPPAPVQLLFPISRFRTMQTLQHSCRFEILKHVRKDHISELPVPQKVKDYLEESQYYVETLCDV